MALDIAVGTWQVKYNDETLQGIEAAEPALDQETVDITTIEGHNITKVRSRSAEVVITAVDTGITNLKKILPNNWLDSAAQIVGQPVGTVVANTAGAIVYGKPDCGTAELVAPLQLVPCDGVAAHTITLFDGVAEITNIALEDGVLKYEITVRSEAVGTQVAKGSITFPS